MGDKGAQNRHRRSPLDTPAGRLLTASLRQWPDFVIIGAQRAGTTSLYRWLMFHPDVAAARVKEIHYFDKHYARGSRWYRSNFPFKRPGQVTGEATPYMLFHPLAPERAARDLPSTTRFIVSLREPVDRAISQYWFNVNRGLEKESFQVALELEADRLAGEDERVRRGAQSFKHQKLSYASRGRYAEQLRHWFAHVDRERILVVESEQLFSAAGPAANDVLNWLGLAPFDHPFPRKNRSKRQEAIAPEVVAAAQHQFEPYNRDLEELLGRPFWSA